MPRGIDHLVLAARKFEAQAELYRKLGFTVGARNRHPWGTLNHIVQFPGCFLELITTEPGFKRPDPAEPVAQFANPIADFLDRREGMSNLVLESQDAQKDQADFARSGIAGREVFCFERTGKRPDGSDVHVAFTLAFAAIPAITEAGFFVCQQHHPENFWNPAFQVHANGVTGIASVILSAEDVATAAAFLQRFAGAERVLAEPGALAVDTGRGRLEVLTRKGVETIGRDLLPQRVSGTHFAAIRFSCPDLGVVRQVARVAKVALVERNGLLVIPAREAFGIALVFGGT